MHLDLEMKNNNLYVSVAGILDDNQAEAFLQQLNLLQDHDFDEVVFNMLHVPVMTSAVIGRLVMFYREVVATGRNFRVCGVDDNLLHLFQSINLNQLFHIEQ